VTTTRIILRAAFTGGGAYLLWLVRDDSGWRGVGLTMGYAVCLLGAVLTHRGKP
jgi:hypothetical protein